MMRTLCLLAIGLLLTGCTSMLLGNTSSREAPATTTAGSATSAADSAISGEIRQKLSADADLGQYTIGIRTQAGRVTLSGTVGGYELRDRAVTLARDTDGVRAVDNRIVVNTNL